MNITDLFGEHKGRLMEFASKLHFEDGKLSRWTKEKIALKVSHANNCLYCYDSHRKFLKQLAEPSIEESNRFLYLQDFIDDLITGDMVDRTTILKHWSNEEIDEVILVVGLFQMMNTVANAHNLRFEE